MDKLITALAPIFAAGLAVQQLLEILTSFFDLDSRQSFQKYKKPILGLVAFALGYGLAANLGLGVLQILKGGDQAAGVGALDTLATGLIISAGTEGVNSILKFLKYSKEEKKREAASTDPRNQAPANGAAPPQQPNPAATSRGTAATEAALSRINLQ